MELNCFNSQRFRLHMVTGKSNYQNLHKEVNIQNILYIKTYRKADYINAIL